MQGSVIKRLALGAVDWGLPLPSSQLERMHEFIQLKRMLATQEINCVVDAGANRGQFAQDLRHIGYAGLIVSFEPVPSEFAVLKEQFADDPAWRGFQVALGSRHASTEMHVIPSLTVMSSLFQPVQHWPGMERTRVEMRRLDEMLDDVCRNIADPRLLLKMDTQGYDLQVFEGARCWLDRIFALQSEVSIVPLYQGMPHYLDALRVYEAAGFRLFHVAPVSRVADGGSQELDCLMIR
jgi:FkbM family methyltransferase